MEQLLIVTPVFNDWASLERLLVAIDVNARDWSMVVDVLIIDDGSTIPRPEFAGIAPLSNIRSLSIATLACNVGHQRAIAIGVAHAANIDKYDYCLVMDSDGEDRPQDIGCMLDACRKCAGSVVVAQRGKRSEGLGFRVSYSLYKKAFRLITGLKIDFGNFCLLPKRHLQRIAHMPDLWNHFASCVIRSRVPLVRLQAPRGARYAGRSSMNFVSLIAHGLSAMAVFADLLFVRLLVGALAVGSLAFMVACAAAMLRLFTDLATPGWATTVLGFAIVLMIQIATLTATAVLMTLKSRSDPPFVPAIHSLAFLKSIERLQRPSDRSMPECGGLLGDRDRCSCHSDL